MNYSDVKDLIRTIDESGVMDFELVIDNVAVKISKNKIAPGTGASFAAAAAAKQAAALETTPRQASPTDIKPSAPITILPEEKTELKGHIIPAPIVGTFYAGPSPDAPAFVAVGDTVKKGEVLCILEAMKIMNEITSDRDGTIAEVLVEDGSMVEYDQPLFSIV